MRSYRDFSINTKLSLLVLLAGGVALFLATTCFVLNDVSMIRSSMVKQTSILAEVLGSNSTAAVQFLDVDRANELLSSLKKQPSVSYACIYDIEGKVFATYDSKRDVAPPTEKPKELGAWFDDNGHLDVVQPIENGGDRIGTIYIHANMDELHDQMLRYVAIVIGMLIVSLGASILLSSRFQRVISFPILRLAEAAQHVSRQRDYSVRVEKLANDELGVLYDQFNEMLAQIQEGEAAIQKAHDELEIKVVERTSELSRANDELSRQIAVRMEAERELEDTHQKLMDAARRAGMAEIATGVLHNVGNVLNSINVSSTLLADRVQQSKVGDLARVVNLLEQHAADIGEFISSDSKGKQIPVFLSLLAKNLTEERLEIISELEQLTAKVEHIKTIVVTQQSYAGVSGVLEDVDLHMMIDDAVKFNATSFARHHVKIIRDYAKLPRVRLDKQKVLQVLVNLLKNAKEAFQDSPESDKRQVIIRTQISPYNRLQIQIIDNAIGIAAEDLTRIFSHGFTTKPTGHGFGLHSCANAAKEMKGSLTVQSEGRGKGATFTLELPFDPVEDPVRA